MAPLLGSILLLALLSQTAPAPAFDVASIHQNNNSVIRWRVRLTPDGVIAEDITLHDLIHEFAWAGDPEQQFAPEPAWVESRRFDISAKFDTTLWPHPTIEQRRQMLRQLLADRFGLKIHHESRGYSVYELRIARKGPRLTPSQPTDIIHSAVFGAMCHVSGSRGNLSLRGCSLNDLVGILNQPNNHLGRVVVDRTGLTGRYTIDLHWSPRALDGALPEDASGPDLTTALQEQVGMELVPAKASLDTIVIDHVELPSAN